MDSLATSPGLPSRETAAVQASMAASWMAAGRSTSNDRSNARWPGVTQPAS
ncbi:hypothetical protein ACLEPN_34980 [Myxococcus sp. 1LA]